jgi:hypothetical protein
MDEVPNKVRLSWQGTGLQGVAQCLGAKTRKAEHVAGRNQIRRRGLPRRFPRTFPTRPHARLLLLEEEGVRTGSLAPTGHAVRGSHCQGQIVGGHVPL